jgi:hypothetical protein
VAGRHGLRRSRAHFGLGAETGIDQVEIAWPSGTVQRLERPAINRVLHVVEAAR